MLFSSNLFLFMFLPAVLLGYYVLPRRLRNLFLLLVSLFFYAWGTRTFVFVMIGSILLNYLAALLMDRCRNTSLRKILLILAVTANLSILFIYKYLDFCIANLNHLGMHLPLQNIALPLGISFFTFQAMSYVIDVYRGHAKAQHRPQNIGLYISFFPQLVAGPIVRYQTIADQIDYRKENIDVFCDGVCRFIQGFAKKIILSNNMALVADAVFSAEPAQRTVLYAWIGALAYAFQILFDFSGYSDMAIGLGKMFGFHFSENFDYPYISASVSEFWRRWHISLGQWFRDYVYFPLGGSRVRSKARLLWNLFVVWALTGIWHGASWNFVVWGLLYFVLIAFEKLSGFPKRFSHGWQKGLYRIFTLLCILVGWVFFRAPDLPSAAAFLQSMLGLAGNAFSDGVVVQVLQQYQFFYLAAILCSTPILKILWQRLLTQHQRLAAVMEYLSIPLHLFLLLWSVSFIMIGSHNPFIYFNF